MTSQIVDERLCNSTTVRDEPKVARRALRVYQRPLLSRFGGVSEFTRGASPNPSADGGSPFGRAVS